MRPAALALALALAPLLAPASGCKKTDPEADGRKVTAESTYDATEPVIHEGFRFRLVPPGPGWKLMRGDDAHALSPTASVAANNGPRFGIVAVSRMPGAELDAATALVTEQYPHATFEANETTTVGGLPAQRMVFVEESGGAQERYLSVVFLREGWLYQLLAWGPASKTPVEQLEPFVAAFSLTEGEIVGDPNRHPPVDQADGPTWVIRGGRFASAISGLQVHATAPWRYQVGPELIATDANAELVVTNEELGLYLSLVSTRYDGGDPSSMLTMFRGQQPPSTGERSYTVVGHEVPFSRHDVGSSQESQYGLLVEDGALTHVTFWYPKALREPAEVAAKALLSGMTLASSHERHALLAELSLRGDAHEVVPGRLARFDGAVHDFAHRVVWTQPSGLFSIVLGDAARSTNPNMVLTLNAPLLGLGAELEVIEGGGAQVDEHHDLTVGEVESLGDTRVVIDGTVARRSLGRYFVDDVEMHNGVLSTNQGGNAVILNVWGSAVSPSIDRAIAEVLDGVSLPAVLPETLERDGRFIDRLHGVSVLEPPDGWIRGDISHTLGAPGRNTVWRSGTRELSLITIAVPNLGDEAWFSSFVEQTLREVAAKRLQVGTPATEKGTLDGHPSRRLVYSTLQAEIAIRDGALCLLVMENVPDATAERFRGSFRWGHEPRRP